MGGCALYDVPQWMSRQTFEITTPEKLTIKVAAPGGITRQQVIAFVQQSEIYRKRKNECAERRGPWCDYPIEIEMSGSPKLLSLSLVMLAPPAVLFGLGLVFVWISAGFRQPKRQ
jgi:hypothetical protein